MNAIQENKLNMFLLVIDNLATEPQALLQTMPGFTTILSNLETTVAEIRAKHELQLANRSGYAIEKAGLKILMATKAVNMANCVKAYAESINNTILIQEMKISQSRIQRDRDSTAADNSKLIALRASENLTPATPFGVTQATIDLLIKSVDDFNQNIPLPRMSVLNKKILTDKIKANFNTATISIDSMDSLVNILMLTQPDFYQKYYFSRKIVNNHGSKLAIRGVITDQFGQFIQDATINIAAIKRTVKSTANGYYEFKNLPAGVHNLVFERPGYVRTTKQVGTVKSLRQQVDATMQQVSDTTKAA